MRFIRTLIAVLAVMLGLGSVGGASAGAAPAPTCTPTSLNTSALTAGSVTVSPVPGSRDASPQTQVSFLGVPAPDLRDVRVRGSRSGVHAGRLLAYSQGDGASFLPNRPFAEGERVWVSAQARIAGRIRPLSEEFAIAARDSISSTPESIHAGAPSQVQYFRSRPDLRPPALTVTVHSAATAPGDEFVAPYTGPGQAGPMILDPNGELLWFEPLPAHTYATDLRVSEYAGKPVLTWWQGDISVHGFGLGTDVIADQSYEAIAHVRAGNGLQADLHEFQLTPQGTAFITAYDPILCNLSSAGGSPAGALTDSVLQEIDVRTGLVMYQWTSLDHVALGESYTPASRSTRSSPYDFFHINSIDLDPDGSLLISARNTWTVYDLDAQSGRVLWRLGGKRSSFAMGPGTDTAWQHDPRVLPNGAISMFDNGASPTVHPQSRGIVVSLDAHRRRAMLLTQIFHSPPLLSESQGNVQALANGDWFVGWGQLGDLSEFNAADELVFDAHFPHWTQSYRDFRFTWTGLPRHPPAFVVQTDAQGGAALYASWNGATGVAAWRVLAGASPTQLAPVAEAPRSGFETAIPLPGGPFPPYVTVQALNSEGAVIGTAQTRTTEGAAS